ncbi:MAG: hypothetical protein JNL74_10740, partial [Fibrobacteres bacterium]|nr:hypothetical protein [Fibrobacterota bacterium]
MKQILPLLLSLPAMLFSLTGDFKVLNSPENVRDMAVYGNTIYCATSGGLQTIDVQTGTVSKAGGNDPEISGAGVTVVTVDPSTGKVYAGFDNGTLCVISGKSSAKKHTDFGGRGIKFTRLFANNGILIIGTDKGLGFFVDGETPVGYPFFERFGNSTNPYIALGKEIRDITVKNDTLYVLTPFFWAKMPLVWQSPFLSKNPNLWTASANMWTTNGTEGDFAYVPPGGSAITGYQRFICSGNILKGITETALYHDHEAGTVSYAIKDSSKIKFIRYTKVPRTNETSIDTTTYVNNLPKTTSILSCCMDNTGRYYVGTSDRNVMRPNDQKSFWNGEVQPFLKAYNLKADPFGNIYALNIENPSTAWENSQGCKGILKWTPSHGWSRLLYTLKPKLQPGINDLAIDKHGRLYAAISELFTEDGTSLIIHEVKDSTGKRIPPNEQIIIYDDLWS